MAGGFLPTHCLRALITRQEFSTPSGFYHLPEENRQNSLLIFTDQCAHLIFSNLEFVGLTNQNSI